MPLFEVHGTFKEGDSHKKFLKKVEAVNENFAAEKALAIIGSKHKTKRRDILINDVKEVKV